MPPKGEHDVSPSLSPRGPGVPTTPVAQAPTSGDGYDSTPFTTSLDMEQPPSQMPPPRLASMDFVERQPSLVVVCDLPLEIQRGFRRKLLIILLLQLALTLTVGFVVRFVPEGEGLGEWFPAQSIEALALCFAVCFTLPCVAAIKDHYPWNMLSMFVWSILLGVGLAVAQLPGSFVRSNTLFIIFSLVFIAMSFTLVFSTCFTFYDEFGHRQLWGFGTAGTIAYVLMLIIGSVVAGMVPETYNSNVGHVVGAILFSSMIFAWLSYDAGELCRRMVPDDYMKGVIYFYTDFIYVCLCCALLGCLGGGAN